MSESATPDAVILIDDRRLTDDERRELGELIDLHGVAGVGRILRMGVEQLLRLRTGIAARPGTVALYRERRREHVNRGRIGGAR